MAERRRVFDRAVPSAARRRNVLAAVLAAIALVFVLENRRDVPNMWRSLTTARPLWCLLAGTLMVLWTANDSALHRATLRATGTRMRLRSVAVAACVAHFLNLTTKSAGAAGLAGFRAEARRAELSETSVTAGYVLAALFTEWAFAAALMASLVLLATEGGLSAADIAGSVVFVVYAGSRIAILVTAIRDRYKLRRLMQLPTRMWSWLCRRSPSAGIKRSDSAADDVFDSLQLVRDRGRALLPAAGHAVATEMIATGILWACLHAVGASLGPLQSLVAYSISGLFGIVGFLPGGLGFVEVSLSAVLVRFGTAGVTAASAVMLYRVFEWWIPVAVGAAFAHRLRVVR